MDILEEWELGHLIPIFTEQKISTMEIFERLDDNDLKELIPTLGDRKKFKLQLEKYKKRENEPVSSIDLSNPVIFEVHDVDSPPVKQIKLAYDTTIIASKDDPSTGTTSINAPEDGPSTDTIINAPEDGPSTDTMSLSSQLTSSTSSVSTHDCFEILTRPSDIINFNLKTLLESHILGRAIMIKHEMKKNLDNQDRNTICEIIICHFLNEGRRLTNQTISLLADQLVTIFQTEKKSTYFVSPIPKRISRGNKSEIARGKLIDKYRNKLTALRKSLGVVKDNRTDDNKQKKDIPPEAVNSQIWLKTNFEPEEDVLKHWNNAYPIRNIQFSANSDFFDEWPILKTQLAITLINYDFNKKFSPDVSQDEGFHLMGRFELFYNNIYRTRKHLLKPSDETLNDLLADEITNDSKAAIRLYLLAALVPPKSRVNVTKKQWKPSISECRDGFVIQVKIAGDIEKVKRERIDFMFAKGLTVQPYIIIVGPNLSNILAAYVIVNNINYKTDSVLSALEFCFQLCIIFDMKYSFECRHLWYLLQWELFNIRLPNDPKIPYISDLLSSLN